jgi:pyruvate,water dikinase
LVFGGAVGAGGRHRARLAGRAGGRAGGAVGGGARGRARLGGRGRFRARGRGRARFGGRERGKFYITQSRPITTLSTRSEESIGNWVFNKKDFLFTFESGGTTFLFEDIVIQHYMKWESLTLAKELNVRVFVPKKTVKLMNEYGRNISRNFIEEKLVGVMESFKIMESGLENMKTIKSINLDEVKKMFEPLKILCDNYSFFDVHYSDGMLINGELTEAGQFVQKNKNLLREAMNMPFFDEKGWLQTGLNKISERFNVPKNILNWYSEQEIYNLFENKLVAENIIQSRKVSYVCHINNKLEREFLEGAKSLDLYSQFEDKNLENVYLLKGFVANKTTTAKIKGVVKKIRRDFSNSNVLIDEMKKVKEDDILVADTTDPDFLPAMKIAKGIITDVGGMLSHASITSRELDKPCIVGTVFASKILNNGDIVEMDLNNGVISILKKTITESDYDFLWRVFTWFPFSYLLENLGPMKLVCG